MKRNYLRGVRHGIPIGIGYFSVSFTFGILAMKYGLSVFQAGLISLTNVTSAGQFAGLTVIVTGATLLEMVLTQLVINSRYALMSLALGQKLAPGTNTFCRCVIAFSNTDEIFAVAMSSPVPLTTSYMLGLSTIPIVGWVSGTICGAVASSLLPANVQSALGVALYGMFIAIVVPQTESNRKLLFVTILALIFSSLFYWLPVLKDISTGLAIVICTVLAAGIGAVCFPVPEAEGGSAS